jgi:hypothetical protein
LLDHYTSENIDMILYMPVLAKLWKQCELWDGTYIITDLLDIHEAMTIKNMNEKLFFENQMKEIEASNEMNSLKNSMNNFR